jgi:hypothetical protein
VVSYASLVFTARQKGDSALDCSISPELRAAKGGFVRISDIYRAAKRRLCTRLQRFAETPRCKKVVSYASPIFTARQKGDSALDCSISPELRAAKRRFRTHFRYLPRGKKAILHSIAAFRGNSARQKGGFARIADRPLDNNLSSVY